MNGKCVKVGVLAASAAVSFAVMAGVPAYAVASTPAACAALEGNPDSDGLRTLIASFGKQPGSIHLNVGHENGADSQTFDLFIEFDGKGNSREVTYSITDGVASPETVVIRTPKATFKSVNGGKKFMPAKVVKALPSLGGDGVYHLGGESFNVLGFDDWIFLDGTGVRGTGTDVNTEGAGVVSSSSTVSVEPGCSVLSFERGVEHHSSDADDAVMTAREMFTGEVKVASGDTVPSFAIPKVKKFAKASR